MYVGVDVGGTNTDAVVVCGETLQVLSWSKETTTTTAGDDVTEGVKEAVRKALERLPPPHSKDEVRRVSVGTTHFMNAVLQRKGLASVSVVRLCGSASTALPPFVDVTEELTALIRGDAFLVKGGYCVDGKIFEQLDEDEIAQVGRKIKESGIRNVVVSGIFSPVNPDQERRAAEILLAAIPDLSVTLSHSLGHMGLLERENAAILNESLKPLCRGTLSRLHRAVRDLGLKCPVYLTQNDGTLVSINTCLSFPVYTFASGATNSMRGAAFLAQAGSGERGKDSRTCLQDAIVVDIGGTSTDVGQLANGFPRAAPSKVEIGGVFTNFRMPQLYSIALGGGSIIQASGSSLPFLKIGPQSVGSRLTEESQCVMGITLTATDLAVKAGMFDGLGSPEHVKVGVDLAQAGLRQIREMVEAAVDRIKISSDPLPLIIVGGGGILLDASEGIKGTSEIVFPENYQVANAVGAALAQVSGNFDQVITNTLRAEAVATAKKKATEEAEAAGALRETIEIVEINEIPVSYLPGNAVRYFVRAVGDLDPASLVEENSNITLDLDTINSSIQSSPSSSPFVHKNQEVRTESSAAPTFVQTPYADGANDDWLLDDYDVEAIAIGAGILGCGGGGSAYLAKLAARQCIRDGKRMRIVKAENLADLNVAPVLFMGAPTVMIEKLLNGGEGITALKHSEQICQIKFDALMTCEIGGANAVCPLTWAAALDLPVVDADWMGRAFPELQMCTPFWHGHRPTPAVLVDEKNLSLAVINCESAKDLEDIFRANVVNFMGASEIRSKCVLGSYSRAWSLGHAVLRAKSRKDCPVRTILDHDCKSRLLVEGKITDLFRKTAGGFARGNLVVRSTDRSFSVKVDFQNENLIATRIGATGDKEEVVLATVPNLIVVVELESGLPLQTEELKYGLRVAVIVLEAPDILLTSRALDVVGPKAFGYSVDVK